MTSSHFLQGTQTEPPLSSVKLHQQELLWQDTAIRVQHFEAEKRIVVFCETLAECFSNAHPGDAKKWVKLRSFSYFLKFVERLQLPPTVLCLYHSEVSFLLLFDSHNKFHSLCTTLNCSKFWRQSLTPHTSVWAKRVQNTVLELKDIYTHIYRRARKGRSTNKFGLITSNKLIFSPRLEKADHFLHKRGKALFQHQINTDNIAPNVMSVQQFYSVKLRIIANRVSDFVN